MLLPFPSTLLIASKSSPFLLLSIRKKSLSNSEADLLRFLADLCDLWRSSSRRRVSRNCKSGRCPLSGSCAGSGVASTHRILGIDASSISGSAHGRCAGYHSRQLVARQKVTTPAVCQRDCNQRCRGHHYSSACALHSAIYN